MTPDELRLEETRAWLDRARRDIRRRNAEAVVREVERRIQPQMAGE